MVEIVPPELVAVVAQLRGAGVPVSPDFAADLAAAIATVVRDEVAVAIASPAHVADRAYVAPIGGGTALCAAAAGR